MINGGPSEIGVGQRETTQYYMKPWIGPWNGGRALVENWRNLKKAGDFINGTVTVVISFDLCAMAL